jgi:aerobic-type carbon monoxide dehydrogenase small subunit (CoxS/CutS family)
MEIKKTHIITFTLNGKEVSCEVRSSALLLEVLRDEFKLKGTKYGCNEGECGSCTVLVNGDPVNSCLFLAVNTQGKNITTIEGIAKENGQLDVVQEAIVQNGGVQCGFCTSGMVLSIKSLASEYKSNPELELPSRNEIKKHLEGNLCRCTGYVKIIDAAEKLFSNKSYLTDEEEV